MTDKEKHESYFKVLKTNYKRPVVVHMFDSLFSPVREEKVYCKHNCFDRCNLKENETIQTENGSVSNLAHQQILFHSLSCNGLREVRKDKVHTVFKTSGVRTQYFSASTKLLCWETIWPSSSIGRLQTCILFVPSNRSDIIA